MATCMELVRSREEMTDTIGLHCLPEIMSTSTYKHTKEKHGKFVYFFFHISSDYSLQLCLTPIVNFWFLSVTYTRNSMLYNSSNAIKILIV